jgi:hypothetical protein
MMGFTADGQHDPQMVAARDERFGISSQAKRNDAKRNDRADIPTPAMQPGAVDLDGNRIEAVTESPSRGGVTVAPRFT